MKFTDISARTCVVFAVLLLVVGSLVSSLSSKFAFYIFAILFAIVPIVFGPTRTNRIAGIIVLIAIIFFSVPVWRELKEEDSSTRKPVDTQSPQKINMVPVPGKMVKEKEQKVFSICELHSVKKITGS